MNPLFFSLLFLASCQIGYAQNTKNKPNVTFLYGNSFVERLQEDGTFEALLHVAEPNKRHKLRSFAYSGDEVGFRIRPEKFGEHSGLGLNIVKNLVEIHGGEITASNNEDKGARIEINFPKA